MSSSGWLFGPLDLDVRLRTDVGRDLREPSWLPKQQPDAFLHEELKLQERVALAETNKQMQRGSAAVSGTPGRSESLPVRMGRGAVSSPQSVAMQSEGSGALTFDEEEDEEMEEEDTDSEEDDTYADMF